MTTSIPDLQLWLLEALLGASAADEIEAQQLLRLPESFPFTMSVGVADLRRYEGFNIHRQGLDMDMVALRKVKLEPPPKPTKTPKKKKHLKPGQASLFDMQAEEFVSNSGKHEAVPVVPVTAQAKTDIAWRRRRAAQDRRVHQERSAANAVGAGVLAFLKPAEPPSSLTARSPPLRLSATKLFRDGHYFGCIALTQAVLEAVIRQVWQVKLKKKPNQEGSFDKNLEALHKKKIISDDWKTKLDQMWADRHSYHHLRPSVESDQQKLEETARNTLKLLNELEREFFGFSLRDGIIVPDHPEYWSVKGGESLPYKRS